MGVPLHPVHLVLEVSLSLSIVDPVDTSLIDETLCALYQVLVVEYLQTRHDKVHSQLLDVEELVAAVGLPLLSQGGRLALHSAPGRELEDQEVCLIHLKSTLEPVVVLRLRHPVVDVGICLLVDL